MSQPDSDYTVGGYSRFNRIERNRRNPKVRRDRGDGYIYETVYPNLTLIQSRLDFITAIRNCAPDVFEQLHKEPLQAFRASILSRANAKTLIDFWNTCYASGDPNYYFHPSDVQGLEAISLEAEQSPSDQAKDKKQPKKPSGGFHNLHYNFYRMAPYFGFSIQKLASNGQYENDIEPKLKRFFDALEAWAKQYNLNVGWMLHYAYLKLCSYNAPSLRFYEETEPPLGDIFGQQIQPPSMNQVDYMRRNLWDFSIEGFEFESDDWRPLVQTTKEFEKRARADFEICLKRYLKDAMALLDLRPDMYRTWAKPDLEHYHIFARYQCDNTQTEATIAKTVNRSASAIGEALNDISDILSLPKRTAGKPGRGRK